MLGVESQATKMSGQPSLSKSAATAVVADRYPGSPDGSFQASSLGYVRKRAVAVILVKTVRGFRRRSLHPGAAEQKDVRPAVVVVIEKGYATAVGLEDVFLGFNAAVNH